MSWQPINNLKCCSHSRAQKGQGSSGHIMWEYGNQCNRGGDMMHVPPLQLTILWSKVTHMSTIHQLCRVFLCLLQQTCVFNREACVTPLTAH